MVEHTCNTNATDVAKLVAKAEIVQRVVSDLIVIEAGGRANKPVPKWQKTREAEMSRQKALYNSGQ